MAAMLLLSHLSPPLHPPRRAPAPARGLVRRLLSRSRTLVRTWPPIIDVAETEADTPSMSGRGNGSSSVLLFLFPLYWCDL
jgi:hypothetical protein